MSSLIGTTEQHEDCTFSQENENAKLQYHVQWLIQNHKSDIPPKTDLNFHGLSTSKHVDAVIELVKNALEDHFNQWTLEPAVFKTAKLCERYIHSIFVINKKKCLAGQKQAAEKSKKAQWKDHF